MFIEKRLYEGNRFIVGAFKRSMYQLDLKTHFTLYDQKSSRSIVEL